MTKEPMSKGTRVQELRTNRQGVVTNLYLMQNKRKVLWDDGETSTVRMGELSETHPEEGE